MKTRFNVLICGGGLQGLELCFLAKQAHWHVVLIDKNEDCPAKNIAHDFHSYDLLGLAQNPDINIIEIFQKADLIIPATENPQTLIILDRYCKKNNLPFAFDAKAYGVSSSKIRSRDFFLHCKSPIPTPFFEENDITYPLLAKPSGGSGSQGVQVFSDQSAFFKAFPRGVRTENWIFEAFYEGPSYSIEVCGKNGDYKAYAVTKLHMDADYDCCAVTTPSDLPQELEEALEKEVVKLAKALNLQGLMDLEVIIPVSKSSDCPYVILEIDARFPSQTPTTVFYATGVNLVEELASAFIDYTPQSQKHATCAIRFEHILYKNEVMQNLGEHIITTHGVVEQYAFLGYPALVGRGENSLAITFIFKDDLEKSLNIHKLKKEFALEHF